MQSPPNPNRLQQVPLPTLPPLNPIPNPNRLLRAIPVLLLTLYLAAGCVSDKKAQMEQHQAYIAGQEQALQTAAKAAPQGPVVYLQGPVQNPVIPWTDGLMLSQAIVNADYTDYMNPRAIRVIRNGQVAADLKGIDLLRHEDFALEAGDTVLIVP